jgi:hypothetical protein
VATQVGSLLVELQLATATFRSELQRAQRALSGAAGDMNRSLGSLERGFTMAGRAAGALGAGLSIAAVAQFTRASLSAAAATGEMAEKLGISTSNLQDYRAAAATAGASTEQMDDALAKFVTRLGQAQAGVADAAADFDRLGLDVRDSSGKVRDADQVWRDFANRIAAIQEPAERAAAIASVLGDRVGPRLALALAEGTAGFDEAGRALERWGGKVSDETIKAARAFDDFTTRASMTLKAWAATAAAEAPGLAERMFAPYLNYLNRLGRAMETLARGVVVDNSGAAPSGGPRPPIAGLPPAAPPPAPRLTAEQIRGSADAAAKAEEMAAADTLGAQQALNAQILAGIAEREARHKAMLDALAEGERMFAEDVAGAQEALNEQQKKLAEEGQRVWEQTRTPLERYTEEVERLNALLEKGAISAETHNRALNKASEQLNGLQRETAKTDDVARSLGFTFSSAFEDAVVEGRKAREVLQGIFKDILRIIIRKAVTEKLAGLAMSGLGSLMSLFSGGGAAAAYGGDLSSMTGVQGGFFADGGRPPVGVPSVVGEMGPELFVPDAAGTIIPHDVTSRLSSARGGDIYNIDARGADKDGLRRLEAMIAAVDGSVERRAVAANAEVARRGGGGRRAMR